jgi:hypothetical protein
MTTQRLCKFGRVSLGVAFLLSAAGTAGAQQVRGVVDEGDAVFGFSKNGTGVVGRSAKNGVVGQTTSSTDAGVNGRNDGKGFGVFGFSQGGVGVEGHSANGPGIVGVSTNGSGVKGKGSTGLDVSGDVLGVHVFGGKIGVVVEVAQPGDFIQAFQGPDRVVFSVDNSGNVHTAGGDVAERIDTSDPDLHPGDVVEIDSDHLDRFRLASTPGSTSVAGVISTNPGMLMNAQNPDKIGKKIESQLALIGRVPVKVTVENGEIRPGDLLVASSTPGHAMRAPADPAPGTVVGKALQTLSAGTGVIEMIVMLR